VWRECRQSCGGGTVDVALCEGEWAGSVRARLIHGPREPVVNKEQKESSGMRVDDDQRGTSHELRTSGVGGSAPVRFCTTRFSACAAQRGLRRGAIESTRWLPSGYT